MAEQDFPERLERVTDLSEEQVRALVQSAAGGYERIEAGKAPPELALDGETILLAFFQPSTRTRLSFANAAARLGAVPVDFGATGSSMSKGESLVETARTVSRMDFTAAVVRQGAADGFARFADNFSGPAANAGSGKASHPTQALTDLATLARHRDVFDEELHIAVIGDILRSRVARSTVRLWPRFGHEVTLIAPPPAIPPAWREEPPVGCGVAYELGDLSRFDAVMPLRVKSEREGGNFPPLSDFREQFAITAERVNEMDDSAYLMHPGPHNPGVEVDQAAVESERSLVREQVTMGVALRTVLLAALTGRQLDA